MKSENAITYFVKSVTSVAAAILKMHPMSSDLKMLSCTFSNFKNTISSKLKAKCQFFSFAFKISLFTDFYNSCMLPLLRFRYSNQSHCWISISHVYIWYLNNPIQKHGFFSFFFNWYILLLDLRFSFSAQFLVAFFCRVPLFL